MTREPLDVLRIGAQVCTQRAQYPLIKEYTLNHKGIHIMI